MCGASWKRVRHDSVPQLPVEWKRVSNAHQNVTIGQSCKPQWGSWGLTIENPLCMSTTDLKMVKNHKKMSITACQQHQWMIKMWLTFAWMWYKISVLWLKRQKTKLASHTNWFRGFWKKICQCGMHTKFVLPILMEDQMEITKVNAAELFEWLREEADLLKTITAHKQIFLHVQSWGITSILQMVYQHTTPKEKVTGHKISAEGHAYHPVWQCGVGAPQLCPCMTNSELCQLYWCS
jgi:hypothetical protein